jgi:hypothetical protein
VDDVTIAIALASWLIWGLIIGLVAIGAGFGSPFPRRNLCGNRLTFLGLALIGALIGGMFGTALFGLAISAPVAIVLAIVMIVAPVVSSRYFSRGTQA